MDVPTHYSTHSWDLSLFLHSPRMPVYHMRSESESESESELENKHWISASLVFTSGP